MNNDVSPQGSFVLRSGKSKRWAYTNGPQI